MTKYHGDNFEKKLTINCCDIEPIKQTNENFAVHLKGHQHGSGDVRLHARARVTLSKQD